MLAAEGVDLLWAPPVEEVYPEGFATTVSVAGLSEVLCGAARPGHFDGVATMVAKLFAQVRPDLALFGEKDWQQLAVIRRMARDLDLTRPFAERILGVPTVREADGLAMSSRNRYLSHEHRAAAATLPQRMRDAIELMMTDPDSAVWTGEDFVTDELRRAGFDVDYVQVADAETLMPIEVLGDRPCRLFVAARIGGTRLIDNMPVE